MTMHFSGSQDFESCQSTPFERHWCNKRFRNKSKSPLIEYPAIIWLDEYAKAERSAKFLELIQNISDYLLFRGNGIFNLSNKNQPYLYAAINGMINTAEYEQAEYTFGEKGVTPIRDNHFYYDAKEYIIGQAIAQPFKFVVSNISNEYSEQTVKEGADMAASVIMELAMKAMAEGGIAPEMASFVTGKVDPSMTAQKLVSKLNKQEYLERIVFDLLQDINAKGRFMKLVRRSWEDKFAVNSQTAMIEERNGEVFPMHVDPSQVSWIGNADIEDFEDPSVIACSVQNYLSVSEILNKYGAKLSTGTGSKGLIKTIKGLSNGKMVAYDPFISNMINERDYVAQFQQVSGATSDPLRSRPPLDVIGQVRWSSDYFYPMNQVGSGVEYRFLEQKMYFKMLRNKRFAVKINGKDATKRKWEEWQKENYKSGLIAEFTELEEKEKADGRFVVEKSKTETYQAVRIGHNNLICIEKYQYASDNQNTNDFPIVAHISRDKSFGLLGYNFAIWSNVIFNRIEEILNQVGVNNILLMDEVQMSGTGTELDYLYNARKSGIGLFNSSRATQSNMASKHMSVTQLGVQGQEVQNLMAMVGLFKAMYENTVGASPQSRGISERYQGKNVTELNIQGQGYMKVKKFHEHTLFMNQVLQRTADMLKHVNAKDSTKTVLVDSKEKKFLKLVSDLSLWEYNIYLESGLDIQQKKSRIDEIATSIASSGGVEILDDLISILVTDNPEEARKILRDSKDYLVKISEDRARQQAEATQALAQAQAQKNEVPIAVEQVRAESRANVQRMKQNDYAERDDRRGISKDIQEENERDRVLFDQATAREDIEGEIPDDLESA